MSVFPSLLGKTRDSCLIVFPFLGVYLRPIQAKDVPSEALSMRRMCVSTGVGESLTTPAPPSRLTSAVTSSQVCTGLFLPPGTSSLPLSSHSTSHLLPNMIAADPYTRIQHARHCFKYFMFIHSFCLLRNPITRVSLLFTFRR